MDLKISNSYYTWVRYRLQRNQNGFFCIVRSISYDCTFGRQQLSISQILLKANIESHCADFVGYFHLLFDLRLINKR